MRCTMAHIEQRSQTYKFHVSFKSKTRVNSLGGLDNEAPWPHPNAEKNICNKAERGLLVQNVSPWRHP
jgi:hypothetical protein